METREFPPKFMSAQEILSNLADRTFVRAVREAYAKGLVRIRCQNLQEHDAIFQFLFGPPLPEGASER